jgi:hypothetical protein
MGVHTGEPMVTEEGYVGTDVHRATRIMRGEHERAGRLWGTIETEMVGAPNGGWIRHRAAYEARILASTTPAFERGRAEGREWTLDDAVSLELDSG